MIKLKIFYLIISLLIANSGGVFSQTTHYQNIFHGGVTASGYSPSASDITFNGIINIGTISPGSTITKAYLIANRVGQLSPIDIQFNNDLYPLNLLNLSIAGFSSSVYGGESGIHIIDVTQSVVSTQTAYTITSSTPQLTSSNRFTDFYLIVYYANPLLAKVCSTIILNDKDFGPTISYTVSNLFPMDPNYDIGLSLSSGYICDNSIDGEEAFVNNFSIGSFGGNDINSGFCGGPFGSFTYENNVFSGINGDDPTTGFHTNNLIKNINGEVSSLNSINLRFETLDPDNFSNSIWGAFLNYSTTCDTFSVSVSPDTKICRGGSLQLNAIGGQSYLWTPSTDLSCTTCPNPIFTGDSSRLYTVQIWNNDSCSVIRPVKINVSPLPEFGAIVVSPSVCGTNSGDVELSASSGTQSPIWYSLNHTNSQTSEEFSNLPAGSSTFTIVDGNACSRDTLIAIPEINPTVAQFSVDPASGTVSFNVSISNNSLFATDFSWSLNGTDQGNNLTSFVCDTSGIYIVQLIAWQFDPSCADTFALSVIALDELIIPTAFTPDNDGVNDFWELPNIDSIYPENIVRIYNRWGLLLFESQQGKYSSSEWNGTINGERLPVGSYYFIIETKDPQNEFIKGIVSIIKK